MTSCGWFARLAVACWILFSATAVVGGAPKSPAVTAPGGLVSLPPEQSVGPDQLRNGGFEQGGADWKLGPCWSTDNSTAHQGTRSLRFDAGIGCARFASQSIERPKLASRSYVLRGWVRATGNDVKARIALHDLNDKGILGGSPLAEVSSTWQMIELKHIDLLPVHDGHALEFRAVAVGGNGTVWFDDLQLMPEEPLPLSAFLLYPNFRGYLWADGSQQIRLQVEVGAAGRTASNVTFTLLDRNGKRLVTVTRPAVPSQTIQVDASALPLGSYRLHIDLTDSSGKAIASYPEYRIHKVGTDFQSKLLNYISPDNFLIRKGRKRFVWGIYDRFSTHRCQGCLSTSAEEYKRIPGFNGMSTVASYADSMINAEINIVPFSAVQAQPPRDQLTPWLRALDQYGVGHLQLVINWVNGHRYRPVWARGMSEGELWNLAATAMSGRPGALGYYTFDEPKLDSIPPVFEQAQVLRAEDPGSVTYGVLVNAQQVFRWRDLSDVIGCDPYPFGPMLADDYAAGATEKPALVRTSLWTRETVRQVYGSRPVWMVLQLFRRGDHFPSYEDMKRQTYKAIINGATGIFWWGFVSAKGVEAEVYIRNNPQAYLDFRRISREVMALEPVLIAPPRLGLAQSSSDEIEYLVKSEDKRVVIFASNYGERAVQNTSFSVHVAAAAKTVEVYAENRTVPLQSGADGSEVSFRDSFDGYDAHVYIIQLK